MLKNKSFTFYSFIIFFTISFSLVKAADWSDLLDDPTVPLDQQGSPNPQQLVGDGTLDRAFSPITNAVPKPVLWRQVLAGISATVAILPAIQVGIPMGMMGVNTLGITSEILPPDSPGSYAVVASMALGSLLAGCPAAYKGALWLTEPQDPDAHAARHTITERNYSWLERLTYSKVTQACQTLFLGGLLFAFIYDMESHVTGWGDTRVWGYMMGLPAFVITYFLLVHATNTPHNHPFRAAMRNKPSEKEGVCREVVDVAEQFIRRNGLTPEAQLFGEIVGVIEKPYQENQGKDDKPSTCQYLEAFKPLRTIYQQASQTPNTWNPWISSLSRWGSLGLVAGSLPLMGITTYDLLRQFFLFCGVPEATAMQVGAGLTGTVGIPALLCIANKGVPLVEREVKDLFSGYLPEEAGHYWGQRIAPALLAPIASLIYFTLPVSHYLSDQVLSCPLTNGTLHNCTESHVKIDNVGGQIMLIIPFAATTLYPLGRQFFSQYWSAISNWVATGAEIDVSYLSSCCTPFKLFPCFDRDNKRRGTLLALGRIRKMKNLVEELNPEYAEILYDDLELKPIKEDEGLLGNLYYRDDLNSKIFS